MKIEHLIASLDEARAGGVDAIAVAQFTGLEIKVKLGDEEK